MMKTALLGTAEYLEFVAELKARVLSARVSAARAVNRDLVLLYWDIGRAVVAAQAQYKWGDGVIEYIAKDLQRTFPGKSGYSVQNLWRMRQFYGFHTCKEFLTQFAKEVRSTAGTSREQFLSQSVRETGASLAATGESEILSQAVRELVATVPWGHHVNLLAIRFPTLASISTTSAPRCSSAGRATCC